MKAVIFSDLHFHPHRFGATVDADGKHSRQQHALLALQQSAAAVAGFGPAEGMARFFCGDMFHVRGKLAPSIINPVIEHFRSVHDDDSGTPHFEDFLVVGNHDMENRSEGEHALKILEGYGVHILQGAGYRDVVFNAVAGQRIGLGWVAYEPDIAELKRKVKMVAAAADTDKSGQRKVFLVHHGVDGAMEGVPSCGFTATDLPHESFDLIYCGDYHDHKEIIPGKAWMVGSPIQHNFGDAGKKRGFMTVDLNTGAFEQIPVVGAPEFVALTSKEGKLSGVGGAAKGNFVRVRADDEKVLDKMEAAAKKAGAIAVMRELVRDWEKVERADLKLSMTIAQQFEGWWAAQALEGFADPAEEAAFRADVIALNAELLGKCGVS